MHRAMPIDAELGRQWVDAMSRAMDQAEIAPDIAEALRDVFGRMSANMATA
jgi:hemoglobin